MILYETSSWHLELILGLLLELIGLLGGGSSCLTKEGLGCDTIIDVLGFKFIWVLLTFLQGLTEKWARGIIALGSE